MATFAEIAAYVRRVEPSQKLGSINYCQMIAELAEALDRLEYNTAVQLALNGKHITDDQWVTVLVTNMVSQLRQQIPEGNSSHDPSDLRPHKE